MKLTKAERELLLDTNGTWAFCGYSAEVKRVASSLERLKFGIVGENDCGPIIRITDLGRAALQQQKGRE